MRLKVLSVYLSVAAVHHCQSQVVGPGDSIRHGCASQDQDNTLDKWGTGLVSAGEVQNKLAIVHFGA